MPPRGDRPTLALVGAKGRFARAILQILAMREDRWGEIRLLCDGMTTGTHTVRGREQRIETLTPESLRGVDIALFNLSAEATTRWAQIAVDAGAIVVDASGGHRLEDGVPLEYRSGEGRRGQCRRDALAIRIETVRIETVLVARQPLAYRLLGRRLLGHLGDVGEVHLGHGIGFGVEIAGLLSPLNGLMQLANAFAVFIIAAQRRVISRDAFKRVTGFQQIKLGFRVVGQ